MRKKKIKIFFKPDTWLRVVYAFPVHFYIKKKLKLILNGVKPMNKIRAHGSKLKAQFWRWQLDDGLIYASSHNDFSKVFIALIPRTSIIHSHPASPFPQCQPSLFCNSDNFFFEIKNSGKYIWRLIGWSLIMVIILSLKYIIK